MCHPRDRGRLFPVVENLDGKGIVNRYRELGVDERGVEI